ncbi:hypothetical protein ACFL41_01295 [Gemmatimonadota bacterium]
MSIASVRRSFLILGSYLALATASLSAQQLTADEVVARVGEAMGGAERIDALKTLQFEVHNWRDGSEAWSAAWDIERPDLIRAQHPNTLVLFDGERASMDEGPPGEPQLLPAESWLHFPWDIALWFPAFFDYETEYLGLETVEGSEYHALRVVMPLGGTLTYHIDPDSYLARTITISLVVDGVERDFLTELSDYRNVDGILFAHTHSRGGELVAVLHEVEFNVPFPDDHFDIGIGDGGR